MREPRAAARLAMWIERCFPALSARRRLLAFSLTLLITLASLWLAWVLEVDFRLAAMDASAFVVAASILLALRAAADLLHGLSRQRWRYFGADDFPRTLLAVATSSAAFWVILSLTGQFPGVPRTVPALEFLLASWGITGIRVAYRLLYQRSKVSVNGNGARGRNVLVVGAGEAGNLISREMERYPEYGSRLIGFADDAPSRMNSRIRGSRVLGTTEEIPDLVERHGIESIVIAIPSAPASDVRRIVGLCDKTEAEISILPPAGDVRAGRIRLSQLRAITVEDLLAREPIRLDLPELAEDLGHQTVLITGAAGSIGSELARQIGSYRPRQLILLDQAESPLYLLFRDLRERYPDIELNPVVADVLNLERLTEVMQASRPDRVYHAAAYKHVPLMESNACEAMRNNVMGTSNVAHLVGELRVEKFVLVSTDKAVDPVSVMGATKRVAELVTFACAATFPDTTYFAVRFGNVLGSQGSVLPIFKQQLAEGKPLTVTHAEMRRYFMTIPEAVQLILQASLLPEAAGRVSMLEMGEQVSILALAKNMLRLAGCVENPENRIRFTGLRAGERLTERLMFDHELSTPTRIPKVMIVDGTPRSAVDRARTLTQQWEQILATDGETALGNRVWELCATSGGRRESSATAHAVGAA